jgi:hypothetical protein
MSELFDSARLKLTGAKEELEELKGAITKFMMELHPYEPIFHPDPDGAGDTHAFRIVKSVPVKAGLDRISLLCSRIASELRDALDQAGYACSIAEGVHSKPTKAYFPICKEEANFDNCVRQNCKHLPADIVTFFRGFKAHPGGDKLLVALNNLAGKGKHCLIEPVMQGITDATYKSVTWLPGSIRPLSGQWDPVKKEIPFFWVKRNIHPKPTYKINMTLFITFGKVDIVEGYNVTGVFDALVSKVESIVTGTEAECRRLRLIV